MVVADDSGPCWVFCSPYSPDILVGYGVVWTVGAPSRARSIHRGIRYDVLDTGEAVVQSCDSISNASLFYVLHRRNSGEGKRDLSEPLIFCSVIIILQTFVIVNKINDELMANALVDFVYYFK